VLGVFAVKKINCNPLLLFFPRKGRKS